VFRSARASGSRAYPELVPLEQLATDSTVALRSDDMPLCHTREKKWLLRRIGARRVIRRFLRSAGDEAAEPLREGQTDLALRQFSASRFRGID